MPRPVLVLAVGNASRGDDALGPLLAERLEAWAAAEGLADLEVLTDIQLNPEHAFDLEGRRRALFVDAGVSGEGPYVHGEVEPAPDVRHSTHSVSPRGVLQLALDLRLRVPTPVEVLAVRGRSFELGAGLSAAARANLEAAWTFLQDWCRDALQGAPPAPSG